MSDNIFTYDDQIEISDIQWDISKLEMLLKHYSDDPKVVYALEKQIDWCKKQIQKIINGE